MWSISGDFISKIYAGTHSVLAAVYQKQSLLDKVNNGVTSIKRFLG